MADQTLVYNVEPLFGFVAETPDPATLAGEIDPDAPADGAPAKPRHRKLGPTLRQTRSNDRSASPAMTARPDSRSLGVYCHRAARSWTCRGVIAWIAPITACSIVLVSVVPFTAPEATA
jgi:hypothetical protein